MKASEFSPPPQSAYMLKAMNRLHTRGRLHVFAGIPDDGEVPGKDGMMRRKVDRRRAKNKVAKQSRKVNRR